MGDGSRCLLRPLDTLQSAWYVRFKGSQKDMEAVLPVLLYFFFLLNGERHENHVLQSELAQLDHHLEMEFTSTKDFLAGNLSSRTIMTP